MGIFFTKFKAGIAKNQNFGDNSFFENEIFIVTWNGAQKFYTPSGELKIFFESYFWVKNMWKKFQPIWKGSGVQLCSLDMELLKLKNYKNEKINKRRKKFEFKNWVWKLSLNVVELKTPLIRDTLWVECIITYLLNNGLSESKHGTGSNRVFSKKTRTNTSWLVTPLRNDINMTRIRPYCLPAETNRISGP